MQYFKISHTPKPPIQYLSPPTFRAEYDESLYINSCWMEGWGYRNIYDVGVQRCQVLDKSEN